MSVRHHGSFIILIYWEPIFYLDNNANQNRDLGILRDAFVFCMARELQDIGQTTIPTDEEANDAFH